MGTEILRPQDCLIERIRFDPVMCSRRRNYGYANPNCHNHNRPNRKPVVRYDKPDQRRQQRAQSEPSKLRRSISDESKTAKRTSFDDLRTVRSYESNNSDLVMEKVTILRRGESLDSKIKSSNGKPSLKKEGEGLEVTGAVRLVSAGPEMVPKQIRMTGFKSPMACKTDVYAGSAFGVSPSPSSLPLPSFSKKKQITIDDLATRDIKRLLRLEL